MTSNQPETQHPIPPDSFRLQQIIAVTSPCDCLNVKIQDSALIKTKLDIVTKQYMFIICLHAAQLFFSDLISSCFFLFSYLFFYFSILIKLFALKLQLLALLICFHKSNYINIFSVYRSVILITKMTRTKSNHA